ncbi:unnamed protein product [Protopolystoma xenopodis]|uniref:Uncharacterized protein n=1 Tax=Protopolystoma xenopodis TaxID=117903 RepID=A0A448XQU7_9PLAT|nr:unnamed protein product [Protopolystoma xenopodis]
MLEKNVSCLHCRLVTLHSACTNPASRQGVYPASRPTPHDTATANDEEGDFARETHSPIASPSDTQASTAYGADIPREMSGFAASVRPSPCQLRPQGTLVVKARADKKHDSSMSLPAPPRLLSLSLSLSLAACPAIQRRGLQSPAGSGQPRPSSRGLNRLAGRETAWAPQHQKCPLESSIFCSHRAAPMSAGYQPGLPAPESVSTNARSPRPPPHPPPPPPYYLIPPSDTVFVRVYAGVCSFVRAFVCLLNGCTGCGRRSNIQLCICVWSLSDIHVGKLGKVNRKSQRSVCTQLSGWPKSEIAPYPKFGQTGTVTRGCVEVACVRVYAVLYHSASVCPGRRSEEARERKRATARERTNERRAYASPARDTEEFPRYQPMQSRLARPWPSSPNGV